MDTITGFSISAATRAGKFAALVLKFQFDDGQARITGWSTPHTQQLLQGAIEYAQYLAAKGVDIKTVSDDVAQAMAAAEALTLDEVADLALASLVRDVHFHVPRDGDLQFTITFATGDTAALRLRPPYVEWLMGYIGNTLNEFEEDGALPVSPEAKH